MKRILSLPLSITLLLTITTSFSNAQVSGTVFRDFNANGTQQAATPIEPGVGGITVKAFNAANTLIATVTTSSVTATLGQYSFPASGPNSVASGTAVRIEFSGLATGDSHAFGTTTAAGNGSDIQFTAAPATNINYGISYPGWYSSTTNPWLATNRYTAGLASATAASQSGTFPNLLVMRHAATGDQTAITTTAQNSFTGAVFGLTYQKQTRKLFLASYLKRLSSFGPNGPGAIYTSNINQSTGAPSNPSLFVDLSTIGISVGADPHSGLPNLPNTAVNDAAAWPLVGKRGIGGIDLSEDGQYLYVVNMNPNGASSLPTLHRIFIDNPAVTPTAVNVTTWDIPTPTLTGATTSFRPMAIKVWKGRIFVGGVCIKETIANQAVADTAGMKAVVYEFNETTGTFSIALTFPLTYKRPYIDNNQTQQFRTHYWGPWQNSTTATIILNDALSGASTNGYPYGSQPMLSNIEFDVNGDMIIAMRDRWGDQMGWQNYLPVGSTTYNAISSAEILRAGNASATTWTIENNATVSSGLSSGGNALPGWSGYFNAANIGPGGGLYYFDTKPPSFNHQFRSNGGLAFLAGSNTISFTCLDPTGAFNTGGVLHAYNTTIGANNAGTIRGGTNGGARVYNDLGAVTPGKAGGMGDLELLTDAEPIQVGNRIWLDTDADGVQDAGEITPGVLAGTTVTLRSPGIDGIYGNGDDQTWTTTTDANGNYYFDNTNVITADNRKPAGWTGVSGIIPGFEYRIEVAVPVGKSVTFTNLGGDDNIDNDATVSGSNAVLIFTAGATNHSYDIGIKNGVLAVHRLDVIALLRNNTVAVNWTTENEVNTSRFYVERSTDNIAYTSVGDLAAAGTYPGTKNYSLTDDIAFLIGNPVIYYKIKLVDRDGKITYSNVVVVRISVNRKIKAWPNPFTDRITVSVTSDVAGAIKIRLVDLNGKIISSSNYDVVKGNNQLNILNLENLSDGMYMLEVIDRNGNKSFIQKLSKH